MSSTDDNSQSKISTFFAKTRKLFSRTQTNLRKKDNLTLGQVMNVKKTRIIPTFAQIKHLPKLLSRTEQTVFAIAIILIIIATPLLVWRLAQGSRVNIPAAGGEYTEGLIGTPQLINPLYSQASDVDTDLTRLIYSGLMRYDSEAGLVPDLAESFTVSEDGLIYDITLKDNARWHDGRNVIPDDIVFTILAIQNSEYRSPLISNFKSISVEQVNENTVRFTLEEPFSPFLSLLTVGILPSHIWGDILPRNALLTNFNTKPIGSGPYKFEKLAKDTKGNIHSYSLTRHDKYHLGAPYVETLTFKFYSDIISAVEALRNGNVEGLSFIPSAEIDSFQKQMNITLREPSLLQYTAAFFNLGSDSAISSKQVRKALEQATDKNKIIEDLPGEQTSINSFILDGMIGEHEEIVANAFDMESAKMLLEDAGWKIEEDAQFRTKNEKELTVSLVALNTDELKYLTDYLIIQWKEIGVNTKVRLLDTVNFQTTVLQDRDYDIVLAGELYNIDPDPYAFWHSSQKSSPGLNLSGLNNKKADTFIETGRKETDPELRSEAYKSLQDIVQEEIAAIFLYQPTYSFATSKKINNIVANTLVVPADRFSNVHEWYIKTKKGFSR